MLELQALTRLAAIDSGSPLEGQALRRLRELYETFTEGHAAAPLKAAAAVLSGAR